MADIDIAKILEALNNKEDIDQRNVDTTAKADAVIDYQEPTSANNYTWYRKYASGWVEQGGKISPHSADVWRTCTLPITMASEYYNVYLSARQKNQNAAANYGQTYTGYYTTTGFNYKGWYNDNANTEIEWLVTGMAAN